MSYWEIQLLSLALAADAFSVGAAVGLRHRGPRQLFRLAFHFGLFQALFAGIGVLAGGAFVSVIKDWDHWVAFGLLAALGIKMIRGAFRKNEKQQDGGHDPTRGMSLIGFSTAVSIDAMAVGIGLAALHAPMALALALIGLTSLVATLAAMLLAGGIAARLGPRMEPAAGLVLIGIGIKILIEHLK
jgi:putative Mn2+ efflux pump MntP